MKDLTRPLLNSVWGIRCNCGTEFCYKCGNEQDEDNICYCYVDLDSHDHDNDWPEGPLAAGEYSYRESFHFVNPDNQELDVTGACEPFKIVDPVTPSPSPSLPKTGDAVGGVFVTGAVLLVAGAGLIALLFITRRRRSAAESGS